MKWMLYLKIFLVTGIPFGAIFGLISAAIGGLVFGVVGSFAETPFSTMQAALIAFVVGGIVAGVPFGAFMSLILGRMHLANSDSTSVRHCRSVFLDTDHNTTMRLCREAIQTIEGVQIRTEGLNAIDARKGPTWKSFGDHITCEAESYSDDGHRVIIESRPRVLWTVVDYGSNLENVESIVSYLVKNGARLLIE